MGLTDAAYFWEPGRGCWSVRPREQATTPMAAGGGALVIDDAYPEPEPPPVTTIAWRINHLQVAVFGRRNARYFGGPQLGYQTYDYPATASEALRRLDDEYIRWIRGIAALSPDRLAANCREPNFEESTMAALILHIHREVIHHGAEIALLRDLYAWQGSS